MKTFNALLKMEYILSKRSVSVLLLGMGMPIAFFLLFSTLWANDDSMSREMIQIWTQRYLMSMTAFSSISFALFTLPYAFQEDRIGNRLKNIQHSPIPTWQYYVAKIIRILLHFVLAIFAVFMVGHFVKGITMPLTSWLASGGLLFFGATCFMPFGLLLGFIKSAEKLSIVSNIIYMGLSVLGGLWMPVETFPDWMQHISKFTPTYHLNNLIISYFDKDFSFQSLLILLAYAMIVLVVSLVIGKRLEVK